MFVYVHLYLLCIFLHEYLHMYTHSLVDRIVINMNA